MDYLNKCFHLFGEMDFNPDPAVFVHIDLNSCFASIEQQANPLLRGKPVVVAAYTTDRGCILAASIEAKRLGIKTGMRVKDAKSLFEEVVVLPPDPWKYRSVHLKLRNLLGLYTNKVTPKSIDEFVLDFKECSVCNLDIFDLAKRIKKEIREQIGEWLLVSIGIAPNRYLAKVASGLHKPDGLDQIDKNNFVEIYKNLKLTDLCGIKRGNASRLNSAGIFTVLDFYKASASRLKAAFGSVVGYDWYLRIRGWEIDDFEFKRRSFGNSFALPRLFEEPCDLAPILRKLTEKTGSRMRKAGYKSRGVNLFISFRDFSFWHKSRTLIEPIFDSADIYKIAYELLLECPYKKPVGNIAVSCFNLLKLNQIQLHLFDDIEKKVKLVEAIDKINERWGDFVISSARMLGTNSFVIDRIAFGGV